MEHNETGRMLLGLSKICLGIEIHFVAGKSLEASGNLGACGALDNFILYRHNLLFFASVKPLPPTWSY